MSQKNDAKIVDGKLVISLPGATNPAVWQMDLKDNSSCAFEVHSDKNTHILRMKNLDGTATDIAAFDQKDDAVDALMKTTSALENTISGATKGNSRKFCWIGKTIMGLVALIIILFFILASLGPHQITSVAPTSQSSNISASQTSGVPISADDFLSGR